MIVYGISCSAFAAASFIANLYVSVTSGALAMFYLLMAAIMIGSGVLKMNRFYSEKL